jgi:hypothetical protein
MTMPQTSSAPANLLAQLNIPFRNPPFTQRHALAALYVVVLWMGAEAAWPHPHDGLPLVLWDYWFSFLFSFIGFLWFCRDRDARGYPRSRWLSVCMVGLGPLAVPYYLVRSRPRGERAKALLRLAAFMLAELALMLLGAFSATMIALALQT